MKSVQLATLAGLALLASAGAGQAGPCADQITDLRKTMASTDAGSGPTMKGTEPGATGSTAAGANVSATPTQVPKAGETPKTEATPAMNAVTQNQATSPQDVRSQIQGQPTSSQVASGAAGGSDRMKQVEAALDRARMADEKGDASGCNSALGDARRVLGSQ
jgi:hypothetical protein